MTETQKILQMIEGVDPNDTDTLDEIDARVWCFLSAPKTPAEQFVWILDEDGKVIDKSKQQEFWKEYGLKRHRKYTRSRDALKAIRPEGWWFGICGTYKNGAVYWCDFGKRLDERTSTPELPTEELAELHAIIQAVSYERKNNAE